MLQAPGLAGASGWLGHRVAPSGGCHQPRRVIPCSGAFLRMGHRRTVGDAAGWRDGGPKVSPALCRGAVGREIPLPPGPGNPLMLFASTGRFTPRPGLRQQIDGEHVAQGSVLVRDPKPLPSCLSPWDTQAKSHRRLHRARPALPDLTPGIYALLPREKMSPDPELGQWQSDDGDRPAGRGHTTVGKVRPPPAQRIGDVPVCSGRRVPARRRAARGAEEGLAGSSITLLAPAGLPKTNRFCAWIKGGL